MRQETLGGAVPAAPGDRFTAKTARRAALALCVLCAAAHAQHLDGRSHYAAPFAAVSPVVDGTGDDAVWADAAWRAIDRRWLGPDYTPDDFSGRFKMAWDAGRIYLLVEITDDILFDSHRDPLVQYWDDDCLEVFVDEDHSGGEHQYNHNAFAYHFSLDNQVIDIGTDRAARAYNDHATSRWRQHGDHIVWEVSISLFADDYVDDLAGQEPVALTAGKTIGLMVAYCDNDGSPLRENFIGSETVPSGPKDRGWIDANLFGAVQLVGETPDP